MSILHVYSGAGKNSNLLDLNAFMLESDISVGNCLGFLYGSLLALWLH